MTEEIQKTRDNDPPMVLNPITGRMSGGGGKKRAIRQYSHNSERITFSFPRTIEGHDMGECTSVEVHFNNIEAKSKREARGVYPCLDVNIDEETVRFSWLISRAATGYAGTLNFLVVLKCVGENNDLLYAYPTEIYDKISVSKGMDNGEAIVEEDYSDLLAGWKSELLAEFEAHMGDAEEAKNAAQDAQAAAEDAATAAQQALASVEELLENAELSVSWDDITDKPFGEEPSGEVLAEGTVICEMQSIGGGVSAVCDLVDPIDLEAGRLYSVEFDGTVYEVTAAGETAAAALALVDGVAVMSESAEETTALMVAAEETMAVLAVNDEIVFISGLVKEKTVIVAPAGQHSYKVSTAGGTIKKIDPKYLPDDLGGGVSSWNDLTDKPFYTEAFEYVANADTVGTETFEAITFTWQLITTDTIPAQSVIGSQVKATTPESEGAFLTVTEEMLVAREANGDALMLDGFPMFICRAPGHYEGNIIFEGEVLPYSFDVTTAGIYSISMVVEGLQNGYWFTWKGEIVHKLDEKYLPEVPTFDLTALGLEAVVVDGDETSLQTDTTEILAALEKGKAKFGLGVSYGSETMPFVVQTNVFGMANGSQYICSGTVDLMGMCLSLSIIVQEGIVVAFVRLAKELPAVTAEDNEKILQVVDGVWTKLAIADSAVKTYIDDYINTALGGDY